MPAILIHSLDGDIHAAAVLWAFEALGQECIFWPSGKFPAEQRLSLSFAEAQAGSSPRIEMEAQAFPAVQAVWNRRPHGPKLPTTLPESEHEFAEIESRILLHSTMRLLSPGALWINPPHAAEADSYKPLQLSLAVKAGFHVPETLFSNDPDAIAEFHRRHNGDIVYKCFQGNAWKLEDGSGRIYAMNRTVPVSAEDLEQRDALSAAPGIFQRRIEKAFELRVTAMGRTLIAARIDSQAHEASREDWRSGQHLLDLEPFTLPEEIAEKCRRYMRAAGLRFGCFDFIVTPEDEYYFLEVNQAGQFLWKEARCPELPMLQVFCDFLIAADPDFLWQLRAPEVTFAGYLASDAGKAFEARTNPTGSAKRLLAPG